MDILTVIQILAAIVFVTWVSVTGIQRRNDRKVKAAAEVQALKSVYASRSVDSTLPGGSTPPRTYSMQTLPGRCYVANPNGYGQNGYNNNTPQYDSSGNLINTLIAYEIMSALLADGSPNPNYDPNYVAQPSDFSTPSDPTQSQVADPSPSVTADPSPSYTPDASPTYSEPSYSSSSSSDYSSSSSSDYSSSSSSYDSSSSSSGSDFS